MVNFLFRILHFLSKACERYKRRTETSKCRQYFFNRWKVFASYVTGLANAAGSQRVLRERSDRAVTVYSYAKITGVYTYALERPKHFLQKSTCMFCSSMEYIRF